METLFGSGVMWATPTITLAGNNIASNNATPIPFGAMQDVSIDFSATVKELYGLYSFPIDVARGTVKISGKAKMAAFQARLFNQLFGETLGTNEYKVAYSESGNVSANNITVVAAANVYADLGVIYASNAAPLTRVAANANTGQYVVGTNGNYTFNEANNTQMYISYVYNANNSGNVWTINNPLLGLSPFFQVVLNQNRRGKHMTLILNRCVSTKITIATKLEDFNIPEFDFSAMADDSGVVGKWSMTEP